MTVALTQAPVAGFNKQARLLCAGIIGASTLSIFLLMATLNMTRTMAADLLQGHGPIYGVQLRYFSPFAPVGMLLLSNRRLRVNPSDMTALCVAVIVIATATASFRIWQ